MAIYMNRDALRLVVVGPMILFCAVAARAACSAPAQEGLALCFPSRGSTVLYPATLEMAANSGSVPITHVTVYDGGTRVDDLGFLPSQLVDFSLTNGAHNITVNAWDANGKLYQAKSSFTITGFGVKPCASGSAEINVCWPAAGSYQPESATVSAAFGSVVTSWSMSLDGASLITSAQAGEAAKQIEVAAQTVAGSHTLRVTAVNAQGKTSTVTRQFNTFYDLSCAPKSGSCSPGIAVTLPQNFGETLATDVATSFRLQGEVTGNPKPTTKMVAYLDGTNVAHSAGPGIAAELTAKPGSHFLVLQAWDTSGKLYETYGDINVQ